MARPAADDPEPVPLGDASTLNIVSDPGQTQDHDPRAQESFWPRAWAWSVDALDPASWGYLGVVMGQEGYPASGVWRIRDVEPTAQQWRFGGAPADTNHTRIIDVAWPEDQATSQEEMLGNYGAVASGDLDDLRADDFAQLQTVRAK